MLQPTDQNNFQKNIRQKIRIKNKQPLFSGCLSSKNYPCVLPLLAVNLANLTL